MKTQVEDINRNIYDIKNKDDYDFKIQKGLNKEIVEVLKTEKVTIEDFERNKKALYGEYVSEYDDVETIGRNFLQDSMKGINCLEYIDVFSKITLEYVNKIQKNLFKEEMSALSIVRKTK